VEAVGDRKIIRTKNPLTVRAGAIACLGWPLGCRVAGNASSTQPTDALDEVPAFMLKEHGGLIPYSN